MSDSIKKKPKTEIRELVPGQPPPPYHFRTVEYTNGDKEWYEFGELHRKDGPAIEFANGDRHWYWEGKLDRHYPLESAYVDRHWYMDGNLHRYYGPAIEFANGDQHWYWKGKLARDDGPAIMRVNGPNEWYKNGIPWALKKERIFSLIWWLLFAATYSTIPIGFFWPELDMWDLPSPNSPKYVGLKFLVVPTLVFFCWIVYPIFSYCRIRSIKEEFGPEQENELRQKVIRACFLLPVYAGLAIGAYYIYLWLTSIPSWSAAIIILLALILVTLIVKLKK